MQVYEGININIGGEADVSPEEVLASPPIFNVLLNY